MKTLLIIIFSICIVSYGYSQNTNSSESINYDGEIRGQIFEETSKQPLAFANIGIVYQNRGTVSNENGFFRLNTINLIDTDTVTIQYIGYKTKKILLKDLKATPKIYLSEHIISISDFFVFGNEVDIKTIVKGIIKNKSINYKNDYFKADVFARNRYSTDIDKLKITHIKNTFEELSDETAKIVERRIPKRELSYTDYLGTMYFDGTDAFRANSKDNQRVKLKPIQVISLMDNHDYTELGTIFKDLFSNTNEGEYWKAASGVFSTKVNIEDESKGFDSTKSVVDYKNTVGSWFFSEQVRRSLKFLNMEDEDDWQFLYETGKYNYTLIGGTKINNENVYIIDFNSKRRGDFDGRMYVASKSYALIKVEYQYSEGKVGTDVSMLGVSYTKSINRTAIFFEKKGDYYQLKYLFRQEGEKIGIDRKVSLIKKKERFLFDKKIAQYKMRLEFIATNLNSMEILVTDSKLITKNSFKQYKPLKRMKVKYVDKFDDSIWEGYSIIAPTKIMREYYKK